ncbi:hypothetical protein C8R44DRAFT_974601 [Mycena epipterygia]|nr:hypothetical protein C8R44DRAFT_974601 [Mycena epipterygia]
MSTTIKRLFHRRSSTNVGTSDSTEDALIPPVPPLPMDAQNDDRISKETHRGMTLPALVISPSSFLDERMPPSGATQQMKIDATASSQPSAPEGSSKNQSVTRSSAPEVVVTPSEEEIMIWRGVANPGGENTGIEQNMDHMEDRVVASSSFVKDVVSAGKAVLANDSVQAVVSGTLKQIPTLMKALEELSKANTFAALAFLPFKFAYNQELKRRDNDRIRSSLFESIKDVMLVAVEMKIIMEPNDERRTPDGQPIATRLAELGEQMKNDIKDCYNVIDAMQKQSLIIKFCKASDWNSKLAEFKVTFKTRKEQLQFALMISAATTIHDLRTAIEKISQTQDKIYHEFQAMKTPQDLEIEAFFHKNGDKEKVLADDAKCASLIQLQKKLTVTHNIQSTYAAGVGDNKYRMAGNPSSSKDKADIEAIRKEFRSDVSLVIQDNLRSFTSHLDLSLHLLGEDINDNIHREGDRMIQYMKDGPHLRLKDRILRQVWKDQGWRGSAKTRILVLALRDYLVERAEKSNARNVVDNDALLSPSMSRPNIEDPQDPETAMGVPLSDSWMVEYLQFKRLRNLQQVLDPDTSGFSTIAEVNAFSQSRLRGWSLPRWVSYWAVGWQIYATRYCTEIDNIFTQMFLIRTKVGIQMPGNKRYINDYLRETWPIVISLTSSIERFVGEDWLADQFKEYIDTQETTLKSRLDRIRYDIDSSDTVNEILRGEHVERVWSIFILIAIIMRRHLEKMHICLTEEINANELFDDTYTIKFVVEAVWLRYKGLVEVYNHQQAAGNLDQNFEWFSCGLFRNYHAWKEWTSDKHYKAKDVMSYGTISDFVPMNSDDLQEILLHPMKPDESEGLLLQNLRADGSDELEPSFIADAPIFGDVPIWDGAIYGRKDMVNTPELIGATEKTTGNIEEGELTTNSSETKFPAIGHEWESAESPSQGPLEAEAKSTQQNETQNINDLTSELQSAASGVWFGFHSTETMGVNSGMFQLNITAINNQGQNNLTLQGEGVSLHRERGTISGTLSLTPDSDRRFQVEIQLSADFDDMYNYRGAFAADPQVIKGTYEGIYSYSSGEFFLKKTPTASIMCHRPLLPRLGARELWLFAYNAIADDLHRRKPSRTYITARVKMVTRCLVLLQRDYGPGWATELGRLRQAFTVREYSAILTLSNWYTRVGDLQPRLWCDSCGSSISRSRVICMDCERPSNSIDFDSRETCIGIPGLSRDDLPAPHLSKHLLVKTRDLLFLKDYPYLKRRATYRATLAADLYSSAAIPQVSPDSGAEPSEMGSTQVVELVPTALPNPPPAATSGDDLNAKDDPDLEGSSVVSSPIESVDVENILNCLICHQRVSAPCWYCIDCAEPYAFVCGACEAAIDALYPWDYHRRLRKEVESPESHNLLHLLIRFGNTTTEAQAKSPLEAPPTVDNDTGKEATVETGEVERQIRAVEQRLLQRMDEDKRQLQELEQRLDLRLARIEALLQGLLPRAGGIDNDQN